MLYCCVGKWKARGIALCLALCLALGIAGGSAVVRARAASEKKFIKWVDFGPTISALSAALDEDIASHREPGKGQVQPVDWVELLACLGARYGGDFSRYQESHLRQTAKALGQGETPE